MDEQALNPPKIIMKESVHTGSATALPAQLKGESSHCKPNQTFQEIFLKTLMTSRPMPHLAKPNSLDSRPFAGRKPEMSRTEGRNQLDTNRYEFRCLPSITGNYRQLPPFQKDFTPALVSSRSNQSEVIRGNPSPIEAIRGQKFFCAATSDRDPSRRYSEIRVDSCPFVVQVHFRGRIVAGVKTLGES